MRATRVAIVALVVGAGVLGFLSPWNEDANPTNIVEVQRDRMYTSIDELAKDSTAVVALTVLSVDASTPDLGLSFGDNDAKPLPNLTAKAQVEEVLAGTLDADEIVLRTLGSGTGAEGFPEIRVGGQYVVFVSPFELERGKPTGDYTITGFYAGLFELAGDDARRLDVESEDLPSSVSMTELRGIRTVSDTTQ